VPDLHIHIPAAFNGRIYLHGDNSVHVVSSEDAPADAPEINPDVSTILDRWEAYDSSTSARRIHDRLVECGWTAHAPREGERAYVRMIYTNEGRPKRRITLYLNTVNLTCATTWACSYAARLPGADQRANGNVVFHFTPGDIDQALAAADALAAHCRGES
jgi:hypothetical protein